MSTNTRLFRPCDERRPGTAPKEIPMNDTTSTLEHVTSKDGTEIGFDRVGHGPAVILVSGGSVDRMSNAGVAAGLASDFTAFNYDRRGRGVSGVSPPYGVDLEIYCIHPLLPAD